MAECYRQGSQLDREDDHGKEVEGEDKGEGEAVSCRPGISFSLSGHRGHHAPR